MTRQESVEFYGSILRELPRKAPAGADDQAQLIEAKRLLLETVPSEWDAEELHSLAGWLLSTAAYYEGLFWAAMHDLENVRAHAITMFTDEKKRLDEVIGRVEALERLHEQEREADG